MMARSKHFKQFVLTSLAGIIVLAVGLATFYYHMEERNLHAIKVEQSLILSRYLSHAFSDEIEQLFRASTHASAEELASLPQASQLHRAMQLTAQEFQVVDIKIHNAEGRTVYSSDRRQIGLDMMTHPGIGSALAGHSFTTIVGPDHYEFAPQLGKRDLLESYVPVRDSSSEIVGVLEVYNDLGPLMQRVSETMGWILAGVSGFLGLFFMVLVGFYARTDRALQKEQEAARGYLRKIEEDRDTLEQRVVERTREVQESDNFRRAVMDCVPLPVVVIDREYRINAMNEAARVLMPSDNPPDQPIHCYRAGHGRDEPCDGTEFPCTLREVIASEAPTKILHTHILPDGGARTVEVMGSPLRDSNGEISGIVEVCNDITEREQAKQELEVAKEKAEAASAAKSRFLANMSHELRTPLTTVIGLAEVLGRTPLESEQRGYLETIGHSSQALLGMIDDILSLSRIEAGKETPVRNAFDLYELVETVLDILGYQSYSKGLELILQIAPEVPSQLEGFPMPLRQILLNLIGNAIKFTDEGEVTVRIAPRQQDRATCLLRFEISDTGAGIPKEQAKQLFEPFVQADHSSGTKQSGVGLGLSICSSLLKLMSDTAELRFVNEPTGGGRFFFDLEFSIDSGSRTVRPATGGLTGQRILVADGSRRLSESMAEWLRTGDMQPQVETDGDQVLQRLRQAVADGQPFFMAVISTGAGRGDGYTLARVIKSDPELAAMRLLMLVLPQEMGVETQQQEIGFDHYLRKPVKPLALLEALLAMNETSESLVESMDRGTSTGVEDGVRGGAGSAREIILLVEDHPVNREVLARMLRDLGYTVYTAPTGREALQALEQRPYSLVLMDCQLPDMNGLAVTEEIRRREGDTRYTPVVAVTALALEGERERCFAVGMDDFLTKPVTFESLQNTLQKWIRAPVVLPFPPTGKGSTPLDVEIWEHYRGVQGAESDFIPRLVDLFLQDTPGRLAQMRDTAAAGDWPGVEKAAHAMKGACAQLGAGPMADLCRDLIAAAQDRDGVAVTALLGDAQEAYRRLCSELLRLKAGALEAQGK